MNQPYQSVNQWANKSETGLLHYVSTHQWQKAAKYIYSSSVLKYNLEVLVIFFSSQFLLRWNCLYNKLLKYKD